MYKSFKFYTLYSFRYLTRLVRNDIFVIVKFCDKFQLKLFRANGSIQRIAIYNADGDQEFAQIIYALDQFPPVLGIRLSNSITGHKSKYKYLTQCKTSLITGLDKILNAFAAKLDNKVPEDILDAYHVLF